MLSMINDSIHASFQNKNRHINLRQRLLRKIFYVRKTPFTITRERSSNIKSVASLY